MKLRQIGKVVLFFSLLKFTSINAQKSTTMPVFFISNATPKILLGENEHTTKIKELIHEIPEMPKAILVISSNWVSSGIFVTAAYNPHIMHDFKGIDSAFYQIKYPIQGAPDIAQQIANTIKMPACQGDIDRGIDYSAWSIARLLYPEGNLPIIQLSVNQFMPPISHWSLGEKLRFLREKGVLIICSGTIVNNPKMMNFKDKNVLPYQWATTFQNFVQKEMYKNDLSVLFDYKKQGKPASLSVPVSTNFMPLFTSLGLQNKNDDIKIINTKIELASVSLFSFVIKPNN